MHLRDAYVNNCLTTIVACVNDTDAQAALVNPAWIVALYGVPLADLKKSPADYTMVMLLMQNWGLWGLNACGMMWATRREGSTRDKSLLCLANIIGAVVVLAVSELKGNAMCADIGMPPASINFNRVVSLAFIGVNYLGWAAAGGVQPNLKLLTASPATASDASNASRYMIVIAVIFGLMMLLDLDSLLAAYQFSAGKGPAKKWVTLVFTSMSANLITNAVTGACLLGASSAGPSLTRWQWGFCSMVFAASCVHNTVQQNFTATKMPVEGQYFNLVLWCAHSSPAAARG
jgi:hypothetical protein